MKRALLILLAGFAATSAHAQLSYTFDSGAEGWRCGAFNSTTLTLPVIGSATWNSAGYIDADDFSTWAFHVSPEVGGLMDASSAYGTALSFDYSTEGSGAFSPFVVLSTGTGSLYQTRTYVGGGAFESYSYALDTSGGWLYGTSLTNSAPATEAQIRTVLQNVIRIGITADVANGADYTRLDNFRLNAVPEPGTLSIIGLGALALVRRRPKG